jgi:UDP-N-acetylmuramoyl-tripeptide--D-alanyl-D-alanine ligase
VYEMAMSAPGEMEALADIVRPHFAVITNIGTAHIGKVGSQDAIAREKKMIASRFSGTETLLVPENDRYRDFLSRDVAGTVVPFGPKVQGIGIRTGEDGKIRLDFPAGQTVSLPLPGQHNGMNALAAIRLAEVVTGTTRIPADLDWSRSLPSGRAELINLPGGGVLVHDAYNANPDSMVASLEMVSDLRRQSGASLVIVLGDMHELGDATQSAHETVLHRALQLKPTTLLVIGGDFSAAVQRITEKGVPEVHIASAPSVDRISDRDLEAVTGNVLVLLKGSRAVGLEALIPRLRDRLSFGEAG